MTEAKIPPGRWLEQAGDATIEAPPHLWGFGALHGGLTLAVLTRAMQHADGRPGTVRSTTGRLHRPITGPFATTTSRPRRGRATAQATDERDGSTLACASLVTSPTRTSAFPSVAADRPPAPPVEDCERFVVPVEFVPISAFTQIRPVGPNRPYAGCDRPELTAWVRLTEDDCPPGLHRTIMLLDALAPSYAAILTTLQPIPTVELTVRPSPALGSGTSPWILLRAVTLSASPDGWLHERIDAWDATGAHLASADQLRTVAIPTPARQEDSP
jgi:hypothetical protein